MTFRAYYGNRGRRKQPNSDGHQADRYLTLHQVKALNAIKQANPTVIRRELYPEPSSELVANSSIYVPSACTVSVRNYQRFMLELKQNGYTKEATVPILKVSALPPEDDDRRSTSSKSSGRRNSRNSNDTTTDDEDANDTSTSSSGVSASPPTSPAARNNTANESAGGESTENSEDESEDEPHRNRYVQQ